MLYPKEDRLNNTLMFACRTCQFSEPAASSCVYRNNLYNAVGETAGVTQDVGSDPTVGADLAASTVHILRSPPGHSESSDHEGATMGPDDLFTCTLCGDEVGCDYCGGERSEESSCRTPREYADESGSVTDDEEQS